MYGFMEIALSLHIFENEVFAVWISVFIHSSVDSINQRDTLNTRMQ